MKRIALPLLFGLGLSSLLVLGSLGDHHEDSLAKKTTVKRVGIVVGIHAEKIPEYKRLHADDYDGVRDLLTNWTFAFRYFKLNCLDGLASTRQILCC